MAAASSVAPSSAAQDATGNSAPLQVNGRLDGADAAYVRAVMLGGDGPRRSVMDAIKVMVAAARLHEAAVEAWTAREASLVDAASASRSLASTLQAQMASQTKSLADLGLANKTLTHSIHALTVSYNALAESFNTLAAAAGDTVGHVVAMERAQRDTAAAAAGIASESSVIRLAAVSVMDGMVPTLQALNASAEFLNALLDALATSGDARSTAIAVSSVIDTRSEAAASPAPLSPNAPQPENRDAV